MITENVDVILTKLTAIAPAVVESAKQAVYWNAVTSIVCGIILFAVVILCVVFGKMALKRAEADSDYIGIVISCSIVGALFLTLFMCAMSSAVVELNSLDFETYRAVY